MSSTSTGKIPPDTPEGRSERAHVAVAHRDDREEATRLHSAKVASDLHEKRTGKKPEASPEEIAGLEPSGEEQKRE